MKNERGISLILLAIIILIVVVVAGSIIFFAVKSLNKDEKGNLAEKNSTQISEVTDNDADSNENDKNTSNKKNWELKEVDLKNYFKDIVINEIPNYNSTKNVKVATTQFDYDINNIYNALKNSTFITDKYVLAKQKSENVNTKHYSNTEYTNIYKVSDSIVGCIKENATENTKYFDDFKFMLYRDTENFSNYKYFSIEFQSIDINVNTQKEIYNLLKEIIGNDLSNALVYKKGESDDSLDFDEIVEINNTKYKISRSINESSKRLSFYCGVDSLQISNTGEFFDSGYKSILQNFKYPISNLLSDKMGNLDLSNANTFADNFMRLASGNYLLTVFDQGNGSYKFSQTIGDNGVNKYECSIEALKGCSDISKGMSPKLNIKYTVYENTNGVFDVKFKISGEAGYKASKPEIVNTLKQQILTAFPDLNLSNVEYDNFKEEYSNSEKLKFNEAMNLWGLEKECEFEFKLEHSNLEDAETGSFTISYNEY